MNTAATFPKPFPALAFGQDRQDMAGSGAPTAGPALRHEIAPGKAPVLPNVVAHRTALGLDRPSAASTLGAAMAVGASKPTLAPFGQLAFALSSLVHAALVSGAVYGVGAVQPLADVSVDAAQVTLISQARFQAMTAPAPSVEMSAAALQMATPEPKAEIAPDLPAETPLAEPTPTTPDPLPAPKTDALPVITAAPPPVEPPKPDAVVAVEKPAPKKPRAEKTPPEKARKAPVKDAATAEKQPDRAKKQPSKPANSGASEGQAAAPSAGKSGTDKAATPSKGNAKALIADWKGKVQSRLSRKVVLPKGLSAGKVVLRLTIAPSGRLLSAQVVETSGQPALDAAALKAARSAAPYPRAPKGLTDESYSFKVPIRQGG